MKKILIVIFTISLLTADTVCSTAPDGAIICTDDSGSKTTIITK